MIYIIASVVGDALRFNGNENKQRDSSTTIKTSEELMTKENSNVSKQRNATAHSRQE